MTGDRATAEVGAASWPPDLEAAFERLAGTDPAGTKRAQAALHTLDWPASAGRDADRATARSALTGDGFPFEFTFSSASTALAYTFDPGFAGPPARGLDAALSALHSLHQPGPDPSWLEPLRAGQQAGSLGYGAWIGARHSADADRFKLYAEIPGPGAPALDARVRETLGTLPTLPDRPVALRMAGLEPATGRTELYFRAPALDPDHLPGLLQPVALIPRAGELAALLAELYGHPLRERIPGARAGFSYALSPGHGPPAFTLFLFARALWGGDARIRTRFAAFCERRDHDPSAYLRVTEPLGDRDEWRTCHGMVGLVVSGDAPIQLALGVRPPPLAAPTR